MASDLRLLQDAIERRLDDVREDLHSLRVEIRALAESGATLHATVRHVDSRADKHSAEIEAQAEALGEIRRAQEWVRAWAAGAVAVLTGLGGLAAWFLSEIPWESFKK